MKFVRPAQSVYENENETHVSFFRKTHWAGKNTFSENETDTSVS